MSQYLLGIEGVLNHFKPKRVCHQCAMTPAAYRLAVMAELVGKTGKMARITEHGKNNLHNDPQKKK